MLRGVPVEKKVCELGGSLWEQEEGLHTGARMRTSSQPLEVLGGFVDGPGLTFLSDKGRSDMAQGPAVGEGPVSECRGLGSGSRPTWRELGISQRLPGTSSGASVGQT